MGTSLEELKPNLENSLKFLNSCGDYTDPATYDALEVLDNAALTCDDPPGLGTYMISKEFGLLFAKMWKELSEYLVQDKWESQGFRNLLKMLATYINMTDESPELCVEIGERGCIKLLVEGLDIIKGYLKNETGLWWVDRYLGLLHNCIRQSSENRIVYRQANAVGILESCLALTEDLLIQVDCLMILAYIVNEKEREIFATSENGLRLLLDLLKKAVETDGHRVKAVDSEFSAYELLDAINLLAINDANKIEMDKHGIIPSIIQMLQDDFGDSDKQIAAEAIWNLSFIESIRKSDLIQETITTLEKLVASQNKDLRGACASAIWQIKGGSSHSTTQPELLHESPPPSYEDSVTQPQQEKSTSAQIMISYQWDAQKMALVIRDKLAADGFKVWMDVTNMKGDILTAMADAVQKSDLILVCMSEKYKDSRCCRSEASYAYKLQKKVIPLLLEAGYQPDGWLGILQGMDLYYEFHTDDHMTTNMPRLLTAINESGLTATITDEETDGPIQATQENVVQAPGPSVIEKPTVKVQSSARPQMATDWTTEHVCEWLQENKLPELCETLHFCDGSHLQKMYEQHQRNEEVFKTELKSDFNMPGPVYLQFIVALEKLYKTQNRESDTHQSTNSSTHQPCCTII